MPLTVYAKGDGFVILDGERRWRCARRLALAEIPAIVLPEPTPLQNIMMMFAIHNTRTDWDPLPTAYKLRELEEEFTRRQKRGAKEKGHSIQIGGELFSDAMGAEGTEEGTYIGMYKHNVNTIVDSLK